MTPAEEKLVQSVPLPRNETDLRTLLAGTESDLILRDRLAACTTLPAFHALAPEWAPDLYRRNPVVFRTLVRDVLRNPWQLPAWSRHRARLEAWHRELEGEDERELFALLLRWKFARCWFPRLAWRQELLARFRAAQTTSERTAILHFYQIGYILDERTAIALYDLDPEAARPVLLTSLLWGPADRLAARAKLAGDETLYWPLWRRSVQSGPWLAELRRLCDEIADPVMLIQELEKRHPQDYRVQLGAGLIYLLEHRGEAVLPYVQPHLGYAFRGMQQSKEFARLRDLLLARGWLALWGQLLRQSADAQEFERALLSVLDDVTLDEQQQISRITLLLGEHPGSIRPFPEAVALVLYRRWPDLVRGRYRRLIALTWQPTSALVQEVLAAKDTILIDHLAAQALTRFDENEVTCELADHYLALADSPATFASRAVRVLGQIPAWSLPTWNYAEYIRRNRLARLLLERTGDLLLSRPALLRDLLEAPNIHAQIVALRQLAHDSDSARSTAAANLDILLPLLLQPLHRRTRLLAFRVLQHAPSNEQQAALILARARDALDLPDRHYPREALVGLLGRLLARWPALCRPEEIPVVHSWEPR